MDGWFIFSLGEFILLCICVFHIYSIARSLKKEEADRRQELQDHLAHKGRPVNAEVIKIVVRGRIKYEIYAEWYSVETEKVYEFYETFWYYRGLLGLRPKVAEGDQIRVIVNFRAAQIYLMERPR